jgi:hypothetical protein
VIVKGVGEVGLAGVAHAYEVGARRRRPGVATPGRTFRHRWEEVGLPWRKMNGSPSGSPDSR